MIGSNADQMVSEDVDIVELAFELLEGHWKVTLGCIRCVCLGAYLWRSLNKHSLIAQRWIQFPEVGGHEPVYLPASNDVRTSMTSASEQPKGIWFKESSTSTSTISMIRHLDQHQVSGYSDDQFLPSTTFKRSASFPSPSSKRLALDLACFFIHVDQDWYTRDGLDQVEAAIEEYSSGEPRHTNRSRRRRIRCYWVLGDCFSLLVCHQCRGLCFEKAG